MADSPSLADRCMEAGMNVELVMYEDVVIPTFLIDIFKTIKQRKLRHDDILLCTFPKSGTHWAWEILSMIVAGKAEYAKHWQNSSWLEYRTEKDLEELESPRVLHTHLPPRMLPESVWEHKCKVVYVQRNPKDVMVSNYSQITKQVWKDNPIQKPTFSGTWEDYVNIFLEGAFPVTPWFDYVIEWRRVTDVHPGIEVCYVKYEDMKQDCVKEIKKMAEFLERPLSEKIYSEIAEACSFQKLKHASENVKDQTFHFKWNSDSEGYFRKGIVGDWKNWFTVAQSERVDLLYEEKLNEKFSF